jgi:elongation factor G
MTDAPITPNGTLAGRALSARAVALVGPQAGGKTTLAEAILKAAGAVQRSGSVQAGTSVGDASPEARARGCSTELNVASFAYGGDRYTLLDCPGSVDFVGDVDAALPAADIAIVVADPDPDKAQFLQPILRRLDALGMPRMIFVNKIDQAHARLRDLLAALETVSPQPLVARQIPIWQGEHVAGYVDLALERAYVYRQGEPSERVEIPAELAGREAEARFQMLERLADYDDALMEQLLSDMAPSNETVFADLAREMQARLITPVFLGSAFLGHGVRRLLKALRHETPEAEAAAERLGAGPGPCAYVMKVSHAGQAGKMAIARVFRGRIEDGAALAGIDGAHARIGGMSALLGATARKIDAAEGGDVAALGKLEGARAGLLMSTDGAGRLSAVPPPERPALYRLAVAPEDRKDDVRLSSALAKLLEEDGALKLVHDAEAGALCLAGQGEIHLRTTLERLRRRYNVATRTQPAHVPFRETIRKSITQRGRHKKQSGGHGQFGDVVVEISPAQRGAGVVFDERIAGGVVPRQWIPAVELGVRDACAKGPLGFPVTDVKVVLIDGSHHAVDSSEIAFRAAGRLAMAEGLAACQPLALEPIDQIVIMAPSSATSRVTAMIAGRRGQIVGFDARADGWVGWDRIDAFLPRAEAHDLIVELRALTQGLGSFAATPAHLAEVSGKLAEQLAARSPA